MDVNKKLFIMECCENDITAEATTALISMCTNKNVNILQSMFEIQAERDVYVGSFFETVVPQYSDSTFKKHFRMTRETMEVLIEDLRLSIGDLNLKVSLEKKVHLTVWMLANHAVSYRAASDLFGMSKGTAHLIFLQICKAIANLKSEYIKWPSHEERIADANAVYESSHIPGIVGCLDGCHIPIKAPVNNKVDFFNRKQFHSVVLQGVCNSKLQFIDVFIGMPGRVHDARVYRNSPLAQKISNHNLLLPEEHLLGDSAYPLSINLMTPYPDNGHLTPSQVRYNKRHASARSVIERVFGILKGKFRRLKYLDMSLLNDLPQVVGACCVLYNIIMKYEGNVDDEGIENENMNLNYDLMLDIHEINSNEAARQKRDGIARNI